MRIGKKINPALNLGSKDFDPYAPQFIGDAEITKEQAKEFLALLENDIEAIKYLRYNCGLGLRAAANIVRGELVVVPSKILEDIKKLAEE
jgi:ribosomal protein L7/L12